ncbi:hypothetical protein HZH68_002424 [Vespula germanica]|uniref:Uncharacterized protein n=1 Tax=Vespula germanica TaxID=30212 RepID=A0A834NMA1_VESGE|nr:hypothetical protein HZH68_002424 [Vespula germanica]
MQKNSLQEIADVHIKSVNRMDMCELFMLLQVFVFSWKRKDPEKDKSTSQRHLQNPTNCNKRQENGPMFFKGMLHSLMREYLKLEFSGVGYRSFHRFYKKLVSSLIRLYAELEWMWRTVDTIWAFTLREDNSTCELEVDSQKVTQHRATRGSQRKTKFALINIIVNNLRDSATTTIAEG